MAMNLLTVEKSSGDITSLAQLLEDKKVLIKESQEVRNRLSRGTSILRIGLGDKSKASTSLTIMHMNQHIIDALDTKALQFVDAVYDSAISNIESEIERISEGVMYNLIKANK